MLRRIVLTALILTLAVPARADDAGPDLKPVSPAGDLSPRTGEGLQPPIKSTPQSAPIKGDASDGSPNPVYKRWRNVVFGGVWAFVLGYSVSVGTGIGASAGNSEYASGNPYIPLIGPFLYISQLNNPPNPSVLRTPSLESYTSFLKVMMTASAVVQIAGLTTAIFAIPFLATTPSRAWVVSPYATPREAGARFTLAF